MASEQQTSSPERQPEFNSELGLFHNHHAVMLLVDPQTGDIVDANRAACDFYGYSHAELTSMKTLDLNILPPEEVRKKMAEAIQVHGARFEFRHRLASGEIRDVEVHSGPVQLDGKTYLCSIIHDYSERKRFQEALWLSERTLQTTLRAAPAAIGMVKERVFDWTNEQMSILTSYTGEELRGKSARMLYPSQEEYERVGRVKYSEIRERGTGTIETRWVCKDGEVLEILLSSTPLNNDDWSQGVIFTATDITGLKRSEAMLRESQARYRQLFDTLQNGFAVYEVVLDENGAPYDYRFLEVNPAFEKLTGLRAEAILGKTILEVLPDTEHTRIDRYSRVALTGEPAQFEEYSQALGKYFEVRAYSPQPGQFATLIMDITQRKLSERAQDAFVTVSMALRNAETHLEISEIILNSLTELLDLDGAALGTLDPVDGEVVLELGTGSAAQVKGMRLSRKDGIIGLAISSGQILVVDNAQADPRAAALVHSSDPTHLVAISLIARGEPIGVLVASKRSALGEMDTRVLASVAEIAANALHRSALHEQTQRSLRRQQSLHKIDQAITSVLDLRVTLSVLIDQIVAQLGVDAASIMLYNPNLLVLECAAARGFYKPSILGAQVPLSQSLAGQIAMRRTAYATGDLAAARQAMNLTHPPASEGFVAYHGSPLIAKGEVKGVLEVYHRASFRADPEWLDFLETLAGQCAIAIDSALLLDGLQRTTLELAIAYDSTLEGWAKALEMRDIETEGHSHRVTEMTLKLARALGIGDDHLAHVRRGALLHDIGKIGIPDEILLKPGPLTAEEWKRMQTHPAKAFQLLSGIPFLGEAADIAYCHHERWDGTGYPRGLAGERIPLAARAFAIVDVWDAMLSDRPYRKALSREETIRYIQEQSGKHFDPRVVGAFLKILPST